MKIQANWWIKPPSVNIYVDEYQLYDLSPLKISPPLKRRFLARTHYYFFEETEEDNIQKCQVTIKDNKGILHLHKTYNQVDNKNRRYYTTQ